MFNCTDVGAKTSKQIHVFDIPTHWVYQSNTSGAWVTPTGFPALRNKTRWVDYSNTPGAWATPHSFMHCDNLTSRLNPRVRWVDLHPVPEQHPYSQRPGAKDTFIIIIKSLAWEI